MEEFILVPAKEDPREVERVKADLVSNAKIDEAAILGARKRRILADKTLSPDATMAKLLPASTAYSRAANRVRQLSIPPTLEQGGDETDKELVTPAIHKWLMRMGRTFVDNPNVGHGRGRGRGIAARGRGVGRSRALPAPPPPPSPPPPPPHGFGDDDDDDPYRQRRPPPPPPQHGGFIAPTQDELNEGIERLGPSPRGKAIRKSPLTRAEKRDALRQAAANAIEDEGTPTGPRKEGALGGLRPKKGRTRNWRDWPE